ncbi:MAG: DUF1318 domain-containing protein [Myxococcales bacterium]|nr:DUF1318 domain-containing protein [Myxococcales bacterium]
MHRGALALVALLAAATGGGCVSVSGLSVMSRSTALERQANAELPQQTGELGQAALSPGPEAIPREQLATSGEAPGLGVASKLVAEAETDADRVDALLVGGCVGESSDGTLQTTPSRCALDVDPDAVAQLVGRENVHRRQVWRYLEARAPKTDPGRVREQWRSAHLQQVVCGGLVEGPEGKWAPKSCASPDEAAQAEAVE